MLHTAELKEGSAARPKGEGAASAGIGPRYLLALGAGLFGALGAFCLFLAGLNATDNLPPPAFSNSLCVDEKLNFLRRHPVTTRICW